MKISEMTQAVLDAFGLTESELAERVGCKQPTINRIKTGQQQPGYAIGAAIQALYEKRPVSAADPTQAA